MLTLAWLTMENDTYQDRAEAYADAWFTTDEDTPEKVCPAVDDRLHTDEEIQEYADFVADMRDADIDITGITVCDGGETLAFSDGSYMRVCSPDRDAEVFDDTPPPLFKETYWLCENITDGTKFITKKVCDWMDTAEYIENMLNLIFGDEFKVTTIKKLPMLHFMDLCDAARSRYGGD